MAGFDDLIDPLFVPPTNQAADPHVVGTSLNVLVTVRDGSGTLINFTTGYTAVVTPYVKRNTALSTFTQTLTSGRQIVLGNGTVAMQCTPAASSALFAPYVGQTVRMTLIVTRTSDGKAAPIWRECYLPLLEKLNP